MKKKIMNMPICGTSMCSGCGACVAVCPSKCMEMQISESGFYRPKKSGNCINCGLCEKVCPQLNSEAFELDDADLYAAYVSQTKERKESSSGGVAYCLANYGVHNGYAVCGVVMNYDTLQAEHKLFMPGDSVIELKGSKYLQSKTFALIDAIAKLQSNENLKLIVFGTPCQVAGYNQVLKSKGLRDRTVLVDIFCHGVPSSFLWNKYLQWLNKKKKIRKDDITSITFRDKKYSWHKYYMHIRTTQNSGADYIANTDKDPFLKIFTMGAVNQKSCFTCRYRNQSVADIRLGDYWGERYKNTEDGVSMVLVNTSNGMNLMNQIREQIVLTKQDIVERFGQQHTDYQYPQYYEESIDMLVNEKVELQSIINLYETVFDRIIKKIKKVAKEMLRR